MCYTEADLDAVRSGWGAFDNDDETWIEWTCPKCKETMDYRAKYYHECKRKEKQ